MSLTTAQAAEMCGMTRSHFRTAMTRARAKGQDFRLPGPDQRTPLWDEAALRAWLARTRRASTTRTRPEVQA